jgi:hypothetical protein
MRSEDAKMQKALGERRKADLLMQIVAGEPGFAENQ